MENIFIDETKIKEYAEIQRHLCELTADSKEEEIDQLINSIPPSFFTQKYELKMICQLFAYYAIIRPIQVKKKIIFLFERILEFMKIYLQDESEFLWNIFGGLLFFKLWMYEEGLISLEKIIMAIESKESPNIAEYFLPEIIENRPEYFEDQLKHQITFSYSSDSIENFKKKRNQFFKWLRNSADYLDPQYSEIETNPIRLAIKTDDIDSFQKILSNSNLSVNDTIEESIFEIFQPFKKSISFLEFSIYANSKKIFKFLILNETEVTSTMTFYAICNNNYEMIHTIESKLKDNFQNNSLAGSIFAWSSDMTEYVLNNYDYDFLSQNEVPREKNFQALCIIQQTFFSIDFIFFQSILLPFLRNNPKFVNENINEILYRSIYEKTGFFTEEFIKHPGVDVNYHSKEGHRFSLLSRSLIEKNSKASEIFINMPKININGFGFDNYQYIFVAIRFQPGIRVFDMICKHKNFRIKSPHNILGFDAFDFSLFMGATFYLKYLLENFPDYQIKYAGVICCLQKHFFLTLKTYLDFVIKSKNVKIGEIVAAIKKQPSYNNEYNDVLDKIALEYENL